MLIALTLVHILVCLFLIVVVLLQSGKAADLAGAFGGMGSQTAFGPRGSATVLSKATTVAAILFMVLSLGLGLMETKRGSSANSVLDKVAQPAQKGAQPAPATKGGQPAAPAQPGAPTKGPTMEIIPEGSDKPIQRIPLELPPNPGDGRVVPVRPAQPAAPPAQK